MSAISGRQQSAGGSSAVLRNSIFEWSKLFLEIQKMKRDEERLVSKWDKCKQFLERLRSRKAELLREVMCAKEQRETHNVFLKNNDAEQILMKGERQMDEVRLMDAERQKLMEKFVHLQEKKNELELRVQSHEIFHQFLSELVKLSKFEDVVEQTDHLESLLNFRDQLFQQDGDVQDQIHKLRTKLAALEDQSRLMVVHRRNQLFHLQNDLERTRSDALLWEQKWNHIEETAAKKTLLLGKIKMGTLNLYEMTGSSLDRGGTGVDVNDTNTQLEKIQDYIQDHSDIVRQYRAEQKE